MIKTDYYVLLAVFIFVGLPLLSIKGCQRTLAWQEEVQLSTGETIMIDREVTQDRGSGLPGFKGYSTKEYLIRFKYPPQSGSTIEWSVSNVSAYYGDTPLVLDISKDKVWFIYTEHTVSDHCVRYVKHRLQNGVWVETPFSNASIDVHQTNLSLASGSEEDIVPIKKGSISIADIPQINSKYPLYLKQVGPQQLRSTDSMLRCVWDQAKQTFKTIYLNQEKKHD